MHIAQKFVRLLDAYRRPDGRRWTGQRLDEATGGVVPRSYFVNLRKGRIESPGYDKLAAIAKAMGFPPELWFGDGFGGRARSVPSGGQDLAGRVEHLFDTIKNLKTGRPYTNTDVARMTLGDLSKVDVAGIRTGAVSDPTVGQVEALAGVFGVEPSCLLDRGEASLDRELVEALNNDTVRHITRESSQLPKRERQMVLGIVRQVRSPRGA